MYFHISKISRENTLRRVEHPCSHSDLIRASPFYNIVQSVSLSVYYYCSTPSCVQELGDEDKVYINTVLKLAVLLHKQVRWLL